MNTLTRQIFFENRRNNTLATYLSFLDKHVCEREILAIGKYIKDERLSYERSFF